MSSLLSQMRAAPSEQIDRREGTRKYQPDYPLNRYVTIPTEKEGLDPKPPPFKLRTDGAGPPNNVYTSPYGVMSNDLMDQFARHFQWKTASQLNYVRHQPKCPPLPGQGEEKFEPRADMVRSSWPGRRVAGGPYEYQKVVGAGVQLPEAKVWPTVQSQYCPFPNNAGSGSNLFREVRHNIAGRTPEETEEVRNHIRGLVKTNNLNTQFVKPMVRYTGQQQQVRTFDPLERPPGRNPPAMTSEYMAQYDRNLPPTLYRKPEFGGERSLSNSVVRQHPYNYFNKVHHPNSLDYLPLPFNLSNRPNDLRLI